MIKDFFQKFKRENSHVKKTIGILGAENGVGTSFISLAIANYATERNVKVAVINYSDKEKYEKEDVKFCLESLNISVYKKEEIRVAFADDEYDIIIYDFGKLNRQDNELLAEFERCYRKMIVTIPSIFKRSSINNVLHYSEIYNDFKTILNMTEEGIAFDIKKELKELDIISLPSLADITDSEGMESFSRKLFYEF